MADNPFKYVVSMGENHRVICNLQTSFECDRYPAHFQTSSWARFDFCPFCGVELSWTNHSVEESRRASGDSSQEVEDD